MFYPKINSVFKRDVDGKMIHGDYSLEEFAYLSTDRWVFYEKMDGMNIRLTWDGEYLKIDGKSENSQIPTSLLAKIPELLPYNKLAEVFPDAIPMSPVYLYGEGYGNKIQKGGHYIRDGVNFMLFDVFYGLWLRQDDVLDIAQKLDISVAPVYCTGALSWYISRKAKLPFGSILHPGTQAEGVIARPAVDLFTRRGDRIITKIKTKDFV